MSNIVLRNTDLSSSDEERLVLNDQSLQSLLAVYPEEQIHKLVANRDKLNKIAKLLDGNINSMVTKASTIMVCKQKKCPFKTSCILAKSDLAPEGYPCPIERQIVAEIESSIVNDLDIDTQNTLEMELLYDFIDAKMLDMRASGFLATDGIVQHIETKVGPSMVSSKDIAPEFKIKVELKKLKFQILEEFMATRKSKKKWGINSGSSFEQIVKNVMSMG